MTEILLNDPEWRENAACADGKVEFFDFPSYREKNLAKQLCMSCPVRFTCISDALENEDRFGMWGGADEQEMRRALSVNQEGKATTRRKAPRCPYCKNEQLVVVEKRRTKTQVHCDKCTLTWWTKRTMNKRTRGVRA